MTLAAAILATLRYCDHFSYPLTSPELHSRLIHLRATPRELNIALSTLVSASKLSRGSGYYALPGRASLIKTRLARRQTSLPKLAKLTPLLPKLARVPGVLAIYLTGSLAMHNAISSDDIDLFIIARPGRLWTTRLLLTLYTELLGLRRRPHVQSSPDQLCFNLYLTPKSFTLPLSKRTLYTAYELIQAVPLYDPHNTRPLLLAANSWIKKYLPNFPLPKERLLDRRPEQRSSRDPAIGGGRRLPVGILDTLESLAYRLQAWYMSKRLTREYITPDSAFFHPHDPGKQVLQKLKL